MVQSVLTGNVPAMARAKLAAFGLDGHLDLDVGAYGDHHEVRAELVHLARRLAGAAYSRDFGGKATVLVGDTPLDVAAALATGARAVGVATGGPTAAELAAPLAPTRSCPTSPTPPRSSPPSRALLRPSEAARGRARDVATWRRLLAAGIGDIPALPSTARPWTAQASQ